MNQEKLLFDFTAKEESSLHQLVELIKKNLKPSSVLLLSGELAAGKTTLTRLLGESLGLTMIQSPTYAIHQRYKNEVVTVDHFDLYRLESDEEIETAGIWDILAEKNNLVIIEWSERMQSDWYLPDRTVFKLNISRQADDARLYKFFAVI